MNVKCKSASKSLEALPRMLQEMILQSSRGFQCFSLISAFPGEFNIVAAEVAVGGCLPVDRFTQHIRCRSI